MKITNIPANERIPAFFTAKIGGFPAVPCFARVSGMSFNRWWPGHQRDMEQSEEAAFLSFSMTDAAAIELTMQKDFQEVVIRPLSEAVDARIEGRVIRFDVTQPGQYSVEVDGIHNPIYIFADPETDFGVTPQDKNVIYFGPGVHRIGLLDMKDGQTLYIDRDAVVYGAVRAINAENIRIVGNGILDNSVVERTNETLLVAHDVTRRNPEGDSFHVMLKGREVVAPRIKGSSILRETEAFKDYLSELNMLDSPIQLYGCKNVELNGFILRDSAGFSVTAANCERVICDNLKLVGMWRYNSDGIDLFNSRDCVIRNCFLRNFDDCIVLKGIPGWDEKNIQNILVENCVLWNDWGRALEIGAETCADEISDIVFRDCDVIHVAHIAMDIQCCDRAWVHDVLYENIRVEFSKYDPLPKLQQSDSHVYKEQNGEATLMECAFGSTFYSNDRVKGKISNITYRNIRVYADREDFSPKINMRNYDDEHTVGDIRYEGIYINGKNMIM